MDLGNRQPLLKDSAGKSGKKFVLNAVHMSLCFFLVFTAFSAIQNLEVSIVAGHCTDCDVYCDKSNPDCMDTGFKKSDVDSDSVTCSWTSNVTNLKYCANTGGDCKNACPNDAGKGGNHVAVKENWTSGYTADFDDCGSGTNVGSVALGLLYATFTLCCLIGPYAVDLIGPKWSISSAFCLFSFFCAANVVVAKFPKEVGLQWGLLVPASAMVGFAASFLWTAQGTYLTTNAILYARQTGSDSHTSALGLFNGIFWGFFQFTQISGNMAESLLLNQAGWSTTALMTLYVICAGAGTVLSVFLGSVSDEGEWVDEDADEEEDSASDEEQPTKRPRIGTGAKSSVSTQRSVSRTTVSCCSVMGPTREVNAKTDASTRAPKTFADSLRGVVSIWGDRRMLCLIPLIMYSGLEQGFIWGDFTSNWVKPSAGTNNIGYVMAAFGASDVLGSIVLGKLSDRTGRAPVVYLGFAAHLAVLITLYKIEVGGCDHKWALLISCACAWGIGDAAFNTQIGAMLGDYFQDRKEDAFSNLKLWQSLMTSVAFFLNLSKNLMGSLGTLRLVLVFCCVATAGFTAGAVLNAKQAKEDEHAEAE
eukprot:TRINITY_DN30615_c0_g1_i1.p1 TRINITY_DN30615_c0_g1~~TRINITY_DN30615_c0_g1_i1.p1  ORF type:complete len:589 (+),score=183.52 TRINITY_DN30615_c0_g1_i1:79-1845(+)